MLWFLVFTSNVLFLHYLSILSSFLSVLLSIYLHCSLILTLFNNLSCPLYCSLFIIPFYNIISIKYLYVLLFFYFYFSTVKSISPYYTIFEHFLFCMYLMYFLFNHCEALCTAFHFSERCRMNKS